tara:strand:- start:22993 stop:24288 length:1296 start_codon:yes stop_codon:yes gene_type:complete
MNPVYILIAILLAIDNIFINFKVGGISYDRLLEFLLFFYFFKSYLAEIHENPFFKKWNIFLLLFAIVQLLINFKLAIVGKIEFDVIYIEFIKCFSFLAFSFLFILIAKKDIRYVNIIVGIHFLICIFAFLQHPMSPIAAQMLEIKRFLYSAVQEGSVLNKLEGEEAYISGGFGDRFRLAGPYASTISFSYFAITSFIINFYLYLKFRKRLNLFFLGTLFVASILSQTRSLLLAEIFLVFGFYFIAPLKQHGLYKLVLIIGAFFAVLLVNVSKDILASGDSRITNVDSGGESDSRPLLWITGIYAVMNYPLGITEQDYMEVKMHMVREFGNSDVLYLSAHNGLINMGFHYSFLGYILIFFMVLFLLKHINFLEPKNKVFFKMALFAYLIQSSFHNNFILNADYPFLMVLMLISVEWYHQNNLQENTEELSVE